MHAQGLYYFQFVLFLDEKPLGRVRGSNQILPPLILPWFETTLPQVLKYETI